VRYVNQCRAQTMVPTILQHSPAKEARELELTLSPVLNEVACGVRRGIAQLAQLDDEQLRVACTAADDKQPELPALCRFLYAAIVTPVVATDTLSAVEVYEKQ
jgi:hypothetical protein